MNPRTPIMHLFCGHIIPRGYDFQTTIMMRQCPKCGIPIREFRDEVTLTIRGRKHHFTIDEMGVCELKIEGVSDSYICATFDWMVRNAINYDLTSPIS